MTIYFCTTTFESSRNGPTKFAKIIQELNDRSNIELHTFTEDISDDSNPNIHKVKVRRGIVYDRIGMISRIKDYTKTIEYYCQYQKPNLILFNNAILGNELYGKGIPCLGMINDYNSVEVSLKKYGLSYNLIRFKVFQFFEKKAVKNAAGILTNSDYLSKELSSKYNNSNQKIHRLYKSVDLECNVNTVALKSKEIINILFVKSNFILGGMQELIEACNLLQRHVRLHIVGPLKEDEDRIKKFSRTEKIELKFYGRLKQEDVYEVLRNVDIFCTPSRFEALGVANMEAMIHRVPVVYTKIGGIPEVMNYGNNGFSCQSEDASSIAQAIAECVDNDSLRMTKLDNAENFVKENFGKDKMLSNLISIFEKYIND